MTQQVWFINEASLTVEGKNLEFNPETVRWFEMLSEGQIASYPTSLIKLSKKEAYKSLNSLIYKKISDLQNKQLKLYALIESNTERIFD